MILAFVIPVLGDVPGEAFGAHLVQAMEVGREFKNIQVYTPLNKMPHDTMRNGNMQEVLDNGADLMFCIDCDTLVPKGAFAEMMRTMRESGAVVVSGHYHRRGIPYTCVWSKEMDLGNGPSFYQVDALAGVHEIHTTGLGCALIDLRWVKAHLSRPWFEMGKNKKGDTIIMDDTTFLSKVREKGGLILGHAGVRCVHLGGRQPVCTETVGWLRTQASESLNPNLEDVKSPPCEELLIQENLNGNDRKQLDSHGRLADEGAVVGEAGVAEEPSHSS